MFIEQRHQKIIDMLRKNGQVEVSELSREFKVSEDSIRRDLRLLAQKGFVQKTYGGAILPDKIQKEENFRMRSSKDVNEKERIGKKAADFIYDGDHILIDGSTTAKHLVPYLEGKKGLTIITNSIPVANDILCLDAGIKLYILGGEVNNDSCNSVSLDTYKMLQSVYVDKVFLSPCAVDRDGMMYATTKEEAFIKEAMIETGKKMFILIDSSKIGTKAFAKLRAITSNDTVITEDGIIDSVDMIIK